MHFENLDIKFDKSNAVIANVLLSNLNGKMYFNNMMITIKVSV